MLQAPPADVYNHGLIHGRKYMISNVFGCDIRLDEATDKDGKLLWRIVVPDEKGKYPEETDDEIFAMQSGSPYKNAVN